MPNVRRPETFNAAVKHLFRHLHDSRRLQSNPIVGHLFGARADISEFTHGARETLSKLQVLVREAAELCRDEGIAAGKNQQAQRQFAILTLHYFGGVPLDQIARHLGISTKHCYRERADICRRIGLRLYRISQPAELFAQSEEAFYFLLARASETNVYTPKAALQACQYLERVARTPQQKLDALNVAIAWALLLGDDSSAQAGYLRATRLYNEELAAAPSEMQRTAEASLKISAWRIADHRGSDAEAKEAVEGAISILEGLPMPQTTFREEFWIDAYVDFAVTLWNGGNLAGAYDLLSHASSRIDHIPVASPLRFRVDTSLWRLRNYLLLSRQHLHTSETRLERLQTVLKQAYESGSLWEAIETLIALVECHVFARRDTKAFQSARIALTLVRKIEHPAMRMGVSIEIGLRLLSTKFWRYALNLFPRGNRVHQIGDCRQRALDHSRSLAALKLGDFRSAWEQSKMSCDGSSTLALRNQLVAAASAHHLGLDRAARETAELAVSNAERLGAVPLLRDAYEVFAEIQGDKRFEQRAREMMRILAA